MHKLFIVWFLTIVGPGHHKTIMPTASEIDCYYYVAAALGEDENGYCHAEREQKPAWMQPFVIDGHVYPYHAPTCCVAGAL